MFNHGRYCTVAPVHWEKNPWRKPLTETFEQLNICPLIHCTPLDKDLNAYTGHSSLYKNHTTTTNTMFIIMIIITLLLLLINAGQRFKCLIT